MPVATASHQPVHAQNDDSCRQSGVNASDWRAFAYPNSMNADGINGESTGLSEKQATTKTRTTSHAIDREQVRLRRMQPTNPYLEDKTPLINSTVEKPRPVAASFFDPLAPFAIVGGMKKLVRWIRKVPLWVWLFLVVTQVGGVFVSYEHWQTSKKILADWREEPIFLRDFIVRMEGYERSDYRDIWIHATLSVVFLACTAIKRRGKLDSQNTEMREERIEPLP